MSLRSMRYLVATLGCFSILPLCAGCGAGAGAYTPPGETARQAVTATLDSWKAGGMPGKIEPAPAPTQAVDSTWQNGQKLESYSIVDEQPEEPAKRFTVKLKLKGAKAETEAAYMVLGRDPVWVYRQEDYDRMINMDNNPQPGRRTGRRR